MKNDKLVLFGVKDTTRKLAEYLHSHQVKIDCIVSLSPALAAEADISDYIDLSDTAKRVNADYYVVKSYSLKSDFDFFEQHKFSLGLAYGWQRLIPNEILQCFCHGVFGFHASPELLPKGRGRSPMNWGLILGKKKLFNHMIQYSADADRGSIYSITPFEITPHDTIQTLMYKSLLIAEKEVTRLLEDIATNSLVLMPQKKGGYFFPKRCAEDGKIDFAEQSTHDIVNLIRGVTHPFPGAFCCNSLGQKIIIWVAWEFDSIIDFSAEKPGSVISALYDMPVVKTVDGTIMIQDYEGPRLSAGESLFSE